MGVHKGVRWGGIARVEFPRSRAAVPVHGAPQNYKLTSTNNLRKPNQRHSGCFSIAVARRRAPVRVGADRPGDGAYVLPYPKVLPVRLVRSVPVALLAATIVAG